MLSQEVRDLLLVSTGAICILLCLVVCISSIKLYKLSKRWGLFLAYSGVDNFDQLFAELCRQQEEVKEKLENVSSSTVNCNLKIRSALRHTGLVRFDAFTDVGGKQSFALAMHDETGNGVLITSIVGRQDCRVYAKRLISGNAERNLLDEEREALDIASG